MERAIRPALSEQLEQQLDGNGRVYVEDVSCVTRENGDGRCFAQATYKGTGKSTIDGEQRLPITVTAGQDGEYLWEVEP